MNFARIQSPSSINTYRQCPRRYFFSYIMQLPSLPSIHLIRGNIVHSTLEDFFKIEPTTLSKEGFEIELNVILLESFNKHWMNKESKLNELDLTAEQLAFYKDESMRMLNNWFQGFMNKLNLRMEKLEFVESFNYIKPKTELQYQSTELGVRGFIDAIHEEKDFVTLIDYKTSKKDTLTDDYKLQLGIYALMYEEQHGVRPNRVGVNFLKYSEKFCHVDDQLIEFAKYEIRKVHEGTQTKEIKDYPKKESALCKWKTGQCDYFHYCSRTK
ncbi:MAG: PD-(D/E)XK nuclease family protein [archaeon]